MALVELLGDKLKSKEAEGGEVETASISGDGKYVGIYFSAHWCPPCRGFTPVLAEFYKKFKERGGESGSGGPSMEIVFVSSDRDEEQFDDYYRDMPWLAMPYALRDKKNAVSKKFKVQGIPTLVILDSQSGEVVCRDGRTEVMSDPEGKAFPWKPKAFSEVIPGKFVDKDMKEFTLEDMSGKTLGIYFSAHWCPPCKTFTPKLAETYNKLKEAGQPFEIVFASRDRDEEHFREYLNTMPWLAFPFGDDRVGELAKIFSISGIPSLIIIDAEGKTITTEGRGRIMNDLEGKEFPWHPLPVYELCGYSSSIINNEPCIILFADIEEDDDVQKAMELMTPVAEAIIAEEKAKGKEAACKFFVAGDDDIVESLQQFLKIKDESLPILVVLDILEQRMCQCDDKEINADVIRATYDKFVKDDLPWTPLQ